MSHLEVVMLLHKSVVHDARVRREATALAAAGHRVTVVELDREARGHLDGFRRISAEPPRVLKRVLPFHAYRVAFLAWFVRRVVQMRPDVVHAHDAAMLLPGLIGARLTGARLVYDSHELATGVPYRQGGWARFVAWVERLAVPRCAAVITVSDGIADRLHALYRLRQRPVVVRNVTNLRAPPTPTGVLRARLGVGDARLVLHQGALAHDRGCDVLIRAIALVPDCHLVFLGSGEAEFETEMRDLAGACGVADRVHFLPSVPLDRLLEHTADADVGVSLLQDTCENHRLALPNKLFEYLAAGVPVIVSDLPEVASLVRASRVGLAVEQTRPEAVAAAIRRSLVLARERRYAGLRASARSLTWAAERERLAAVYARIDPRTEWRREEPARANADRSVA